MMIVKQVYIFSFTKCKRLSILSDLLFFYQSLFLYSLCLADVAGRFKAVSLNILWCVRICVLFWLMKSGAGGHSGYAEMQI